MLLSIALVAPVCASYFEMERPSTSLVNITQRTENAYADSEAAVGIGVHIAWYVENPDQTVGPFYGNDGFVLSVVGTANVRRAFGINMNPLKMTLYPFALCFPAS